MIKGFFCCTHKWHWCMVSWYWHITRHKHGIILWTLENRHIKWPNMSTSISSAQRKLSQWGNEVCVQGTVNTLSAVRFLKSQYAFWMTSPGQQNYGKSLIASETWKNLSRKCDCWPSTVWYYDIYRHSDAISSVCMGAEACPLPSRYLNQW